MTVNLGRRRARLARVLPLVSIVLLAALLRAVYGDGYVGYDGTYSLLWGNDLAHGRLPDLDVAVAPTPHPLSNVAGALVSPLDDEAPSALRMLVTFSFAALGWGAFRLGQALFSAPVGVLFALILLTRDLLVGEALQASVDIPFMALVIWAMVLEARKPKRGPPVLALLSLAGLLRPEAWLAALAYLVYLLPDVARRERVRLIALAISAPVAWAAIDLALTGNPLFSLQSTQDLAAQLERPRHLDTALRAIPSTLELILNEPVAWSGVAGTLVALWLLYERALLPFAVMALGLGSFVALGIAELPLLARYLLIPAAMLALFSSVAAFGWLNLPRGASPRTPWTAASLLLLTVLLVSGNEDRKRIDVVRDGTAARRDAELDLRRLATSPAAVSWYRRCPQPIRVPNHGVVPLLAYWLEKEPEVFATGSRAPERGVLLAPVREETADLFVLEASERGPASTAPEGFRRVTFNRSWSLLARC
jgi:hypothetical protein